MVTIETIIIIIIITRGAAGRTTVAKAPLIDPARGIGAGHTGPTVGRETHQTSSARRTGPP